MPSAIRKPPMVREDGFTILELLVAATMGLVLIGTAVGLMTSGLRSEPELNERAAHIQEARVMTEQLTRELRQGSNAASPDPTRLMVRTYVPRASCTSAATGSPILCGVFYSCSGGTCVRTQCPPAAVLAAVQSGQIGPPATGCGATTQVVSGLMSDEVFTFSPREPGRAFIAVRLAFPAQRGDDAITVEDGIALRNPPVGSS